MDCVCTGTGIPWDAMFHVKSYLPPTHPLGLTTLPLLFHVKDTKQQQPKQNSNKCPYCNLTSHGIGDVLAVADSSLNVRPYVHIESLVLLRSCKSTACSGTVGFGQILEIFVGDWKVIVYSGNYSTV